MAAESPGSRWAALVDPYVIAVALNVVVAVAGLGLSAPGAVLDGWLSGFAGLWGFAMQMLLMLVLGHALAVAPPVLGPLGRLAAWIAGRRRPAFWITLATGGLSWLHWGLGLVAGGLIARAATVAAGNRPADAVRFVAAAYGGFLVWHVGLSGSAPLTVATPGHFLADTVGVVPLAATIFAPWSLLLVAFVLLALASAVGRMNVVVGAAPSSVGSVDNDEPGPAVSGPALGRWIGSAGLAILLVAGLSGRLRLDLNSVILTFMALGLVAHGHLAGFTAAVRDGVGGTVGILLQFPLYGAIMGMMQETGLAARLAQALVEGIPAVALPAASFLSAGLINLLVPSGGGQWAVQGPILGSAAVALGAPIAPVIVGFAWGDAWTNLIQPFWALPLLALTGVHALDLLKVTWRLLLISGLLIVLGLLLLP
jgi:short-chain fatty acids transporter